MYFIVIDTVLVKNAHPKISVILECPFLVIPNAVINWRNDTVKLSFGNMTPKLNVFNVCKKSNINSDKV